VKNKGFITVSKNYYMYIEKTHIILFLFYNTFIFSPWKRQNIVIKERRINIKIKKVIIFNRMHIQNPTNKTEYM